MTLVDSSVLIDLLERQQPWFAWSVEQLDHHRRHGGLAVNAIVCAEVSRSFAEPGDMARFLDSTDITLAPIPLAAAFSAAAAHQRYRASGGERLSPLPDFFIGAHAEAQGWSLLSRDAARIRTYFPGVRLIAPTL